MSSFQISRLILGPPPQWHEGVGDPVTNLGGAAIPAPRQAIRHLIDIATWAADTNLDTVAARLKLRRQLRALFNNTPMKLQGFFYVVYSDDSEQNGWYIPDFGQLADIDGSSGLATGVWKLQQAAWIMQGHPRYNRDARQIWMKDYRTGLPWRDTLKLVYSTDFSALPALPLTFLPHGASSVSNAVSGQVTAPVAMPTGRDGGIAQLVIGPIENPTAPVTNNTNPDLAVLAFDQTEASRNLSDVVVYDRRGNLTGQFYKQTVLNDNPLAYWRLDETSGTTAVDQLGGNPGTYTGGVTLNQGGALTSSGDNDASVLLNGTTGYVTRGDNTSLDFSSGPLSVEAWVKPSAVSALQGIAGKLDLATPNNGYQLYISTGFVWFTLRANGNSFTISTAISAGAWIHVVGTYDGLTQRLYVNGLLVASRTTTLPGSLSTHTPFLIGAISNAGIVDFLGGNPDEVAVYSYTLTPTQVQNHYSAGQSNIEGTGVWEEVYGPDYPWSWQNSGGAVDAPVIENQLCRVRFDPASITGGLGNPGFRVDVWNGTAYVEQGKMTLLREAISNTVIDTWISASLVEYTPDRATIQCVMASSTDASSRERVFITLQRGELGCTFEYYAALRSDGARGDAALRWAPAINDLNESALIINSPGSGNWTPGAAGTGLYTASAGSGAGPGHSGPISTGILDSFNGTENWCAILRCPAAFGVIGPYQTTLVVLQLNTNLVTSGTNTASYGSATDSYLVQSGSGQGYVQCQVQFTATQAQQIMESETMANGAGSSGTSDAAASGGIAITATRTTDANAHSTQANWPNSFLGTYRVFARVKTSASTLNIYAKTGATTGATVTTTSTSYVWMDLGEIVANNTTLEIHCWATAAATVSVDRIEAVLVSDRTRNSAIYSGARDQGQSALFDSRTIGTLVAR